MPAGNGTGPMGMGPMTGRAAGYCAGQGVPGYLNPAFGPGVGRGRAAGGRGGGRGWRNRFYATGLTGWQRAAGDVQPLNVPDKGQQVEALRNQAAYFEGALSDLRKRLDEMEADGTGKSE